MALIEVESRERFVETKAVRGLVERAEMYLVAGFPVHFRGPSGTGKTTLALHVARRLGRPVVMILGDEEYTTAHLVGRKQGYRLRRVADNFIRTVRRYEEELVHTWVDDRLAQACKYGYTLIYDEFNRSRPEANNVLLSVFQEGILTSPSTHDSEPYIQVHPEFRALLTSNPDEYAGVHSTQDALKDRLITLDLGPFDRETELAVVRSHAPGLGPDVCRQIVELVDRVRSCAGVEIQPNIRTGVKLACVLSRLNGRRFPAGGETLRKICLDVLASGASRTGSRLDLDKLRQQVGEIVRQVFQADTLCAGEVA